MLNFIIFSKIYLSVNCPVGEPAVGELGVGELVVGELACRWTVLSVKCLVGEPAVSELGVGELSFGEPTRTLPFLLSLCCTSFSFLTSISQSLCQYFIVKVFSLTSHLKILLSCFAMFAHYFHSAVQYSWI